MAGVGTVERLEGAACVLTQSATEPACEGATLLAGQTVETRGKAVIRLNDGTRLDLPRDINLWEGEPDARHASTVVAPLNPAAYGVDPLALV